VAKAVVKPGLC